MIKGWDAYSKGKAKSISGIKTPDKSTISFTLTEPTGDFLYRMAMPATAPIPAEVGKCFDGQARQVRPQPRLDRPLHVRGLGQGRHRARARRSSRRAAIDGQTTMTLVRNPNYNAATDTKAARENLPD